MVHSGVLHISERRRSPLNVAGARGSLPHLPYSLDGPANNNWAGLVAHDVKLT